MLVLLLFYFYQTNTAFAAPRTTTMLGVVTVCIGLRHSPLTVAPHSTLISSPKPVSRVIRPVPPAPQPQYSALLALQLSSALSALQGRAFASLTTVTSKMSVTSMIKQGFMRR